VPIADDILHVFELVDQAFGFWIIAGEFGDVAGALSNDSVVMEGSLRECLVISNKFRELP